MKKNSVLILLFTILAIFTQNTFAQKSNDNKKSSAYQFTDKVRLAATSVKDQYRSGTCWSFSAASFLESEMLRIGKETVDLSEMYVVNLCYKDKAEKYVRLHGSLNFGGGGAFHDLTYVMMNYGLVPEEAYTGLNYGTDKHVHGEFDDVLKSYVKSIIRDDNKEISTAWKRGFDAVVDSYLGKTPEKFTYKGKEYTPKSFAKDYTGLNAEDYIEISSFTHHPFYSKFIIEIPDNWLWDIVYNVPINEMEEIIDNALDNGYTIAWGADVSDPGFSYDRGVAVIPEISIENTAGLEQAKWDKMSQRERIKQIGDSDKPMKEKVITQELRQKNFDNFTTTDDHGMHIIGKAVDQTGAKFYIVKNSWSENGVYNGYFYASRAFVLLQTTDLMVNKNSVPAPILKKLGL